MELLDQLKNMQNNHRFFSIKERKNNLKKLLEAICVNEKNIIKALDKDLRKSEFESYTCEISFIKSEIKEALKNIDKWANEKIIHTPLAFKPAKSLVKPVAKGLVLIIAPWNYPFLLSLVPFVSALAAGNSIVLKPSEITPNCALLIKNIIESVFSNEHFLVTLGDEQVAKELLLHPFDHIFYTGSTNIGKEVMMAAAKNLTSVTLELGGKSPVIIHESCNLKLAAKRIMWAKCLNAGQTCVAPDYIIIPSNLATEFVLYAKEYLYNAFGKNPKSSASFGRIVSKKHFSRLIRYLSDGFKELGGSYDEEDLYIEPTIISGFHNNPIMKEEIFGPILAMLFVDSSKEAVDIIKKHPYPLALYIFGYDEKFIDDTINSIPSGSVAINDCISQIAIPNLPFGGVRHSGIGNYHGHYGFLVFSQEKSIYKRFIDVEIPARYPPYSKNKLAMAKWFL